MKMKLARMAALIGVIGIAAPLQAIELDASPTMATLSDRLVDEGIYTRVELEQLIGPLEIDKGVLKLFDHTAEGVKPWYEYREIFLNQKRIVGGRDFMKKHRELLDAVEQKYGVPPEIITALIGVETYYGTRMGSRNVLRSLATLTAGFPRREEFFGKELETFLRLLKAEHLVAEDMEGSYAGAVGIPQFMPTSYVAYAVDFNENGKRDLVQEIEDAAGSVANYLVKHGWERDAPVAMWVDEPLPEATRALVKKRAKPGYKAKLLKQKGVHLNDPDDTLVSLNRLKEKSGPRYFVGYANFYALTRYNPSNKYAMAIVELSEAIAKDK